ncbi:MAG: hypothetical protein HGA78_00405 [Nitrospirales bacterium]|nr:hypothetical protein [Nitrospirales bacterium]
MYIDKFGALPLKESLMLTMGQIEPIPEISEAIHALRSITCTDDYVYPPIEHRLTSEGLGKPFQKVPQSERPALLHRLPATHTLQLNTKLDKETARFGIAGLLMHFTSFLF